MSVRSRGWLATFAILAVLLSGCAIPVAQGGAKEPPATVEHQDNNLSRIRLSGQAAKRLGVETAPVRAAATAGGPAGQRTIPYSAVLYDPRGATWTYTNPEPLVFVRAALNVQSIAGGQAVLTDGPPVGALVVVVGAPELFGIEFGIGTSGE
jgi:hypothetical protein